MSLCISILVYNFILLFETDLALQIANDYGYLIKEQDVDGMTALQLLACKPEAFDRKWAEGFFNKLIYYAEVFLIKSECNFRFCPRFSGKHWIIYCFSFAFYFPIGFEIKIRYC